MNADQIDQCRQKIDPVCFAETYETNGFLDFLSFLFVFPAIAICIFEDAFSYGLCVGSSGYVLALRNLQYLGVEYWLVLTAISD